MKELLDAAAELVTEVPSEVLTPLCAELEKLTRTLTAGDVSGLVDHLSPASVREKARRFILHCGEYPGGVSGPSAAWMLRCAIQVRYRIEQSETIELIWSGPSVLGTGLRRTEQVLIDLIDSANYELLLVMFAAYSVPSVLKALKRAAAKGVRMTLVLETPEESGGKLTIQGLKDSVAQLGANCHVYVWPASNRELDKEGRSGSLHAKCLVADRQRVLIGSANLTGFALDLNIEIGVAVRSLVLAAQVLDQFRALIANGVMVSL